jgi:asparagine synthase (glutamine-hydrolysing)
MAERGTPFEVRAHTVVYDTLFRDEERHYAALVARHLGISIDFLVADNYPLFDSDEGPRVQYPEPVHGHEQSALMHSFNRQVAGASRVALTGLDGDAVLTAHWPSHFVKLWCNRRLRTFCADAFRYAHAKQDLLRAFTRRVRWPGRRGTALPAYPSWLNGSSERGLQIRERWESLQPQASGAIWPREGAYSAMTHPNWLSALEGFDAGTARVPVDHRHPLLDLRLVEFFLSLPAVPWCVDKHVLRSSASDMLPRPVLRRPKAPLSGDPVRLLLRESRSRLRNFVLHPDVWRYVDKRRFDLLDEVESEAYWFGLRVLIFNRWLSAREGLQR